MAAAVLPIACASAIMMAPVWMTPSGVGASSGTSINTTTTARSWSRSTEKVARPYRDPVSPRSCST
eukprot:671073-Pyramimonas_sp.AAC.1